MFRQSDSLFVLILARWKERILYLSGPQHSSDQRHQSFPSFFITNDPVHLRGPQYIHDRICWGNLIWLSSIATRNTVLSSSCFSQPLDPGVGNYACWRNSPDDITLYVCFGAQDYGITLSILTTSSTFSCIHGIHRKSLRFFSIYIPSRPNSCLHSNLIHSQISLGNSSQLHY